MNYNDKELRRQNCRAIVCTIIAAACLVFLVVS